MPVNEEDVVNIMGGMPEGIRLNDHRRRLKNRWVVQSCKGWGGDESRQVFRFELCKKLGQGTYGKVQLGINKETGQRVSLQLKWFEHFPSSCLHLHLTAFKKCY